MVDTECILKKVTNLMSDRDFLSRKLAGKEFEITCGSCSGTVKITVSPELTGKCPVCGYENQITFAVK